MQANFLNHIVLWIIVWAAVWIPCFFWFKRGATYINRSVFFSLYFTISSVIAILIFKTYISPVLLINSNFPKVAIIVTFGIIIFTYALAPHFLQRPDDLIAKSPSEHFLYLDFRYLAPKIFEIIFQQIMIVALTIMLSQIGLNVVAIVAVFAVLFGFAHVGIFKTDGKFWGWFFTITATISAFIFPVLILKVEYGFVYSFILHLLFYIPSGVIFWTYQPKN